jgi:hypothetical protein
MFHFIGGDADFRDLLHPDDSKAVSLLARGKRRGWTGILTRHDDISFPVFGLGQVFLPVNSYRDCLEKSIGDACQWRISLVRRCLRSANQRFFRVEKDS